jgi:L-ascorbate metabolism protein UlaG (beta-lactamase superfamily)
MLEKIRWLGHDSFLFDAAQKIYIDPWQLPKGLPTADLVLITHEHGDHCSPDDVKKVQGPGTVILAPALAAKKLAGDVRVVQPGDQVTIQGILVEAVPAYNVNKFRQPGVPFHPKEARHVGYIVEVEGQRIYHAGDTDVIPEMDDVRADIALLPVSGTYVMTADEAAEAAKAIQPRVAIPMHIGRGVAGSPDDLERFRSLCPPEVQVVVLDQEA